MYRRKIDEFIKRIKNSQRSLFLVLTFLAIRQLEIFVKETLGDNHRWLLALSIFMHDNEFIPATDKSCWIHSEILNYYYPENNTNKPNIAPVIAAFAIVSPPIFKAFSIPSANDFALAN